MFLWYDDASPQYGIVSMGQTWKNVLVSMCHPQSYLIEIYHWKLGRLVRSSDIHMYQIQTKE